MKPPEKKPMTPLLCMLRNHGAAKVSEHDVVEGQSGNSKRAWSTCMHSCNAPKQAVAEMTLQNLGATAGESQGGDRGYSEDASKTTGVLDSQGKLLGAECPKETTGQDRQQHQKGRGLEYGISREGRNCRVGSRHG